MQDWSDERGGEDLPWEQLLCTWASEELPQGILTTTQYYQLGWICSSNHTWSLLRKHQYVCLDNSCYIYITCGIQSNNCICIHEVFEIS